MTNDAGGTGIGPVRVRWQRLHAGDERRTQSRALLSEMVRDVGRTASVRVQQRCATCGSHGHGAIGLPGTGLVASVSYAGEWTVVGVAPVAAASAVGIDIERIDAVRAGGLVGPALDAAGWTRLEAAVKADRRGFVIDPGEVRVRAVGRTPFAFSATVPGRADPIDVGTVAGPPEHVVSVAIRR